VKRTTRSVHQYTAFFEANEHGGYMVTVPSLPSLVTERESLDDARSIAKDAIRCYIEGLKKAKQPVPLERETAQLKVSVMA
jgi:predicted RNase H-like HicB family nuclease